MGPEGARVFRVGIRALLHQASVLTDDTCDTALIEKNGVNPK